MHNTSFLKQRILFLNIISPSTFFLERYEMRMYLGEGHLTQFAISSSQVLCVLLLLWRYLGRGGGSAVAK